MTEKHLSKMIGAGEAGSTKLNCSMAMVDVLSGVGNVPRKLYREAHRCALAGDTGPETNKRLLTRAFEATGVPIDPDKILSGRCVTREHLREDFEYAQREKAFFAIRVNARARDLPHIWGVNSIDGNKVTVVGVCEGGRTRQRISIGSLIKRMRKVAERGENNACLFIRK